MKSNFHLKILTDAPIKRGQRVLLRLDLALPILNGAVSDDFRLKRSMPTLKFLSERGAKTIIISHTNSAEDDSLAPVCDYLKKFISVSFVPSLNKLSEALNDLKDGEFLFLENIRKEVGETENDTGLSKKLASFADIYVNDAFSASHRSHASLVGVPQFLPSFGGLLLAEEIKNLSKAFNPKKPFLFILAGSKFETKMPLVKKYLETADSVFIGGALANDLLKAKGYEIGLSSHATSDLGFKEILKSPKLILPIDVVTEHNGAKETKGADAVSRDEIIFDAGPKTIALLKEKIAEAKFVLWNGTLGVCEKGFKDGTDSLAQILAERKTESIIGGGDTVAEVGKLGLLEKFSFVSTGGGAMLDFLANETLPGIEALKNRLEV